MPFQPKELTLSTFKGFVDRLHRFAKHTQVPNWPPKRAWAQEAISHALGFPNFHAAQKALQANGEEVVERNDVYTTRSVSGDGAVIIAHAASLMKTPLLWIQGPGRTQVSAGDATPILIDHHMPLGLLQPLLDHGNPSNIVEFTVGLMKDVDADHAIWKNRAISLFSALMFALCELRNQGRIKLTRDVVSDYMRLDALEQLSVDTRLSPQAINAIKAYLRSLPGYESASHAEVVLDNHGYLTMQFTRILHTQASDVNLDPRMHIVMKQETMQTDLLTHFIATWGHMFKGGTILIDGCDRLSQHPTFSLHAKKMARMMQLHIVFS